MNRQDSGQGEGSVLILTTISSATNGARCLTSVQEMESQSGKSRLAFGFHLLPFENCHAAQKCLFWVSGFDFFLSASGYTRSSITCMRVA